MQELIIKIMEEFGYFGITLLIALENVFPPIPSEVILTFGGFMTAKSSLTIFGVIVFSTVGAVIGALILYFVGRVLKKERLIKLANGKVGKTLRFKEKDIERASEWFSNKGEKTVFFCRFVPIIRSLISIPAGINQMRMTKFLFYTSIGTLIWNTVLTILGSILGENYTKIVEIIDIYGKVVLVLLLVVFVLAGVIYYKKRIKKAD